MEPRIQYAQTEDGVSIAFWTLGEGMPVVLAWTSPFSHIQLEWQMPEIRPWYERLAERRRLVRYDCRGAGLSKRYVDDYSLEAHVLDLEAVADRLRLERFALLAIMEAGPVAISYAARHPERVSHLVLWCSWARASDYARAPGVQAVDALLDKDWEIYLETMAHVALGWSEAQHAHARRYARLMNETVTQEAVQAAVRAMREFDAAGLLPKVQSSTLVLHRRQAPFPDVDVAKGLASRIPDAHLSLLEGTSLAPYLEDMEAVLSAVDGFLGEGEEPAEERTAALPEGTAVILFLDIADSTALTEQLGDAAFRAQERELDAALRAAIRETRGTPVEGKVLGDGVMAVFTSARQAIDAAQRCRDLGNEAGLPLHLGIHAGDVIREGNNVHGGAVNIAARIADASAPGEILVSDTLRGLARTSAGVAFEDRGGRELKGIAEPQRLFAVRTRES